jgi:hypothetical protein
MSGSLSTVLTSRWRRSVSTRDLARGRLRAKRAQLEEALQGYFTPHHRFLLTEYFSQMDD